MGQAIPAFFGKIRGPNSFADFLNFRFTVGLLSSLSVLIMIRILISEPITCYTPATFTDKQAEHIEKMCWVTNSRYDFGLEIDPKRIRSTYVPLYHQWIPIMFALQALLFYIPNLLWKLGSSHLGSFNVRHIESAAARLGSNAENATQTVQYMAKCLGQHLLESGKRWKLASFSGRLWLLVIANYTALLYAGVKLLCIVNIIGQFVLLDAFLGGGGGERYYGFSVLKRLLNPQEYDLWTTSKVLPTSFFCDITLRLLGNLHRHTLHCSLPLNLWYETVFLFLWFWFVFVAVVTIGGLVVFVVSQLNVSCQKSYCSLRLIAMEKATESQIGHFVNVFLTRDAWLILRQVGKTSGDETATRLICALWDVYCADQRGSDVVADAAPKWKADLAESAY